MSTNTGVAPRSTTGDTEAIQFVSARITSSPGPMPRPAIPMCSAPVQLEVAIAKPTPRCAQNCASKRWM
jgi:hypothetical protein